ncbi:MAG: ABC transporter permease [Chloroflexi bacterium]|jgi:simple sugar transport system permease protein|nr:ABC transporter permease [Chloroflexota bacterium]
MGTIEFVAIFATLSATIRQAIPITLGAMSGISSERSGIVNIGIEGMMLISAFTGYMMNAYLSGMDSLALLGAEIALDSTLRLALSVAVGLLTGGMMGLLHALLCIQFKVDHIISGVVINLLATGISGYFYDPQAETEGKIPELVQNPWPDGHFLNRVGVVLFDKDVITYITFILVALMTFWLFSTVWGLRTRSIGENPRAADTLGINVYRLQYTNLFLSGTLAGLAGVYLTLADVGVFERNMVAGKGFIALAVMIFGKWHPVGALGGALLFGFLSALQSQLQFFGINVPHQLVSLLPYAVTVVVLAGFVGQARPPAHVGQAYEVEGQ